MVSQLNIEILKAMKEKEEVTLNELYEIIGEHPDFLWEISVRKHRVRSALDNLKRQNKARRSLTGLISLSIRPFITSTSTPIFLRYCTSVVLATKLISYFCLSLIK